MFFFVFYSTRLEVMIQFDEDNVDGSEIPNNHLGCNKSLVNTRINYQPQLVSRISEPSTVCFKCGWFNHHL